VPKRSETCAKARVYSSSKLAREAREGQKPFDLQNAIEGPNTRSRNAILHLLTMGVLIRHIICGPLLGSRSFGAARQVTRKPENPCGPLHLDCGFLSFAEHRTAVQVRSSDHAASKDVPPEPCKNFAPVPRSNVQMVHRGRRGLMRSARSASCYGLRVPPNTTLLSRLRNREAVLPVGKGADSAIRDR